MSYIPTIVELRVWREKLGFDITVIGTRHPNILEICRSEVGCETRHRDSRKARQLDPPECGVGSETHEMFEVLSDT